MARYAKCKRLAVALLAILFSFAIAFTLVGCDHEPKEIDSDSPIKVAFLASTGGVNDGTLCEADYKMLVQYCDTNNIPFRYYQHARENKVESEVVIDAAVADGYNVIIACDYTYASALAEAQFTYPEIMFISLDTTASDYEETGIASNNVAVGFQERISGYFAGYAAVALGYSHIGFLGGMAVPAVINYQEGYVWGANQAASDKGIASSVIVESVMGNQFYGDSDITAYMDAWYMNLGVQCVFSCGGGIYTSNAEAAEKTGSKTIGVDSDQKEIFDEYAQDMCITSALKNTPKALEMLLDQIRAGNFSSFGGKALTLGLADPDNPDENFVGLPTDSTQWSSSFTLEDYTELVSKVYNGETVIPEESPTSSNLSITMNDRGSIK